MRDTITLGFGVALFTAFSVLSPMDARAAECAPQKISTSVDLIMHPSGVPLAPVTLAGKQKLMIVDTGGYVGELFPAAVRQLGLQAGGPSSRGVVGVDGVLSRTTVIVPDFVLGSLRAANYKLIMASGEDTGDIPDDQPSGLLAPDILQNYDADFDFGSGKLNLIDPNHCKGQVVYWQARNVATIPFRMDKSFHIVFPVTVDGKKLDAVLDTGASQTIMNLSVATSVFRLKTDAADVEKIGELKGEAYTADVYRRRFKTIAFGGITVSDPVITLLPDMTKNYFPQRTPIGSLIPDSSQPRGLQQLLLGMSTLSKLHVYIAYKERRLYISEAAPAQ